MQPQIVPSAEQLAIIHSSAPAVMVEAVAGSGKTTVLAWTLQAELARGTPPERLLALCFSQGAQERFASIFAATGLNAVVHATVQDYARRQLLRLAQQGLCDDPVLFGTHEPVRPHLCAAAAAVWERRQLKGVGHAELEFDFSFHGARLAELVGVLIRYKAGFSGAAQADLDDDEIALALDVATPAVTICREYERRRHPSPSQINWQARFDCVPDLVELLAEQPALLGAIAAHHLCVVDEWHDINAAEFELIRLISQGARLVAVGDRDQIIHSERGAHVSFSASGFDFAFAQAQRYGLTYSHRFGPRVAKIATTLAARKCRSAAEPYTEVRFAPYDGAARDGCATALVSLVRAALERDKKSLARLVVLVPSADASIELENALIEHKIPYFCSGFDSYLLRPEILMLRGLLHIAVRYYDTLKGDALTCARLVRSLGMYAAARFDSDEAYGMLLATPPWMPAEKKNALRWREAEKTIAAEPAALPGFFSGVLCRATALDSAATLRWKTRFAAIAEEAGALAAGCSAHQVLQALARALDLPSLTKRVFLERGNARAAVRSIESFAHFAARLGDLSSQAFLQELTTRQKALGGKTQHAGRRVQLELSTIHHAKGKEWPHVVLAHLERGRFPRGDDLAEERRLLYVAVTRARDTLTIFEPSQPERRSLFSDELGRPHGG